MAQAVETARDELRHGGGFLATLRRAWQRRQRYRRAHARLCAMSTRELSDLGISRGMISRLAQDVADGRKSLD